MTAVFAVPVTVAVNCCWAAVGTVAEVGETVTATPDWIATVALADLVGSACEVAVTLTVAGFGTAPGAVYKPEDETVPHAEPLQPAPLTLHVTAVSVEPVTVALNCCCAPVSTCANVGLIVTATGVLIETAAVPKTLVSAREVAITVT